MLTGQASAPKVDYKLLVDGDGLWNGYHVYELATPEAFAKKKTHPDLWHTKRGRGIIYAINNVKKI